MDMDQRTRLIGGRGGRVILLGDGTEIITGTGDDDDVDMGEAEEVDSDVEEQIKKGQAESSSGETDSSRVQREGTPGPKSEEPKQEPSSTSTTDSSSTPEEPKMKAATDGAAK